MSTPSAVAGMSAPWTLVGTIHGLLVDALAVHEFVKSLSSLQSIAVGRRADWRVLVYIHPAVAVLFGFVVAPVAVLLWASHFAVNHDLKMKT